MRRRTLLAAGLAALPAAALAQGFPARPIRLVIPFAAGGPTDIVARLLAERMAARLGQPVVVEARPGAGGALAAEAVARAAPDGHTLLIGTATTHAVNPALQGDRLPFHPIRDFAPIAQVARAPIVLAVRPEAEARDLAGFVALLRARPGQLNYGSSGTGSMGHLASVLLLQKLGAEATHIPYRGSAPMAADLVSGRLDFASDALASLVPFMREGRVRALAIATPDRATALPDLPTFAEAGLRGLYLERRLRPRRHAGRGGRDAERRAERRRGRTRARPPAGGDGPARRARHDARADRGLRRGGTGEMGAGGPRLRRHAELKEKLPMDGLRSLYPEPSALAVAKQLDRLDPHAIHFIGRSPFLVMATADAAGACDASPRGDAPGFVAVLDGRRLVIPDRPGNNRVDSLGNLAANPQLGLLFFVPGVLETLRVNGRAALTTDPAHLAPLAVEGRPPRSGLLVTVEEVFFHCGKALKRSALWDPARHAAPGEIPSLGRILADQTRAIGVAEAEARVATGYRDHLY